MASRSISSMVPSVISEPSIVVPRSTVRAPAARVRPVPVKSVMVSELVRIPEDPWMMPATSRVYAGAVVPRPTLLVEPWIKSVFASKLKLLLPNVTANSDPEKSKETSLSVPSVRLAESAKYSPVILLAPPELLFPM